MVELVASKWKQHSVPCQKSKILILSDGLSNSVQLVCVCVCVYGAFIYIYIMLTHTHTHTHTHIYIWAGIHTYIQMYICVYIHTHTLTHTHIYTHIIKLILLTVIKYRTVAASWPHDKSLSISQNKTSTHWILICPFCPHPWKPPSHLFSLRVFREPEKYQIQDPYTRFTLHHGSLCGTVWQNGLSFLFLRINTLFLFVHTIFIYVCMPARVHVHHWKQTYL